MIARWILPILLALFTVLIVSFAVLMAGYGIAEAVGDAAGAGALRWIAITCLVILAVTSTLLLGTLGLLEVNRSFSDPNPPAERDDPPPRTDLS